MWLEACPSFTLTFDGSREDYCAKLLYVHAGTFARHLLSLHRARKHEEFPAVANFIERLLTEGDQETRQFGITGILEAVQNVWGHTDVSPEEFVPFLKPVSAKAWNNLNRFWAGEIPIVPDSGQAIQ